MTPLKVSSIVGSNMASIHRRPLSPYWHAAFLGSDGRRVLRSTKLTDKTKAMAMALELERASKLARSGTLVEEQARRILSDLMGRVGGGELKKPASIREYFAEWVKGQESVHRGKTASVYKTQANRFIMHLGQRAARPLSSLSVADISGYRDALLKVMSVGSAKQRVRLIALALRPAVVEGKIATNVASAVQFPKSDRKAVRGTFSREQIQSMLGVADTQMKSLILLGYFAGARLADCASMQWSNVKLDAKPEMLEFVQRKTGKELKVPIHEDLRRHLVAIKPANASGPIMPILAEHVGEGVQWLSTKFSEVMELAGIDPGMEKIGARSVARLSFHALRHSFASALANAGVPPELRMKLTGHADAQVHQGYSHHEHEVLAKALAKMPGLGGGGK